MRSVLVHAVLAVVGLAGAYMAWTDEGGDNEQLGEVTVLPCKSSAIKLIEYKQDKKSVKITRRTLENQEVVWVETRKQGSQPNNEEKVEQFVGGDGVDEYFGKISPLRALRALGTIKKKERKDFGFDEEKSSLKLSCGGRTLQFEVGGTTYGSGDRYMQRKDNKKVYLFHADVLRDLRSAEFRLMQRALHRFESKEVHSAEVVAGGKSLRLLQRNRLDEKRAEWVQADAPDRRNELYGNWLDRVSRLRAQSYLKLKAKPGSDLTAEDISGSESSEASHHGGHGHGGDAHGGGKSAGGGTGEVSQVVTIRYLDGRDRELGFLEIAKVDAKKPEFYAKSEATKAWVKVPRSLSEQIAEDVDNVIAGKVVGPEGGAKGDAAAKQG